MIGLRIAGRLGFALLAAALAVTPVCAQWPTQDGPPVSIEAQIASLAQAAAGRIGVAAMDLTTGDAVSLGAADRYPMASTVKIAIAGTFLTGVDEGRYRLDQMFVKGGAPMTAARAMELMLIRSDNHAADLLLKAVGGPAKVNAWLSEVGVTGQHMDRTIARLVLDDRLPARVRAADLRDTSTPSAMIALLGRLRSGLLLSESSTRYLFDVMARCVTGRSRIPGMLPAGTPIAHKTGTLDGVSDDVGIVTLPNGHDMAIAIFAHGMRSDAERNGQIARIARLLYDHFGSRVAGPGAMGLATAR